MYTFSEPIRRGGGTAPVITTLWIFQCSAFSIIPNWSDEYYSTCFVFNHSISLICFENGYIISFIYFEVFNLLQSNRLTVGGSKAPRRVDLAKMISSHEEELCRGLIGWLGNCFRHGRNSRRGSERRTIFSQRENKIQPRGRGQTGKAAFLENNRCF